MFEGNLQLPEEGAMCMDSNLQAAKYLIIYLMKRMQKGINTWWKVNINTSRKDKLKAWEKGYRPDVTGDSYPIKSVDPLSGEPHALEGMDYLTWMRNHGKYRQFVEGNESIIVRSYNMARFLHKLRWAFYRIGLNQNDLSAMIAHNKNQTEQQKVRRAYLGGSAPIVEGIVIQSDPSYVTMCRLIKLVTGCESFSMLSAQRSSGKHLSIDMEALVGDPLVAKGDVDQELLLLMNQYGLSDFLGHAKTMLQNLKDGNSFLGRQLIDNENYSLHIPQLQYAPPQPTDRQGNESQGSDPRPKGGKAKGTSKSSASPTVFAHTTFHRKVALTVVRWEPVRKLVLTRQILLLLLGKKPKDKNVKRRMPHMPPPKDTTTIQVNLLNSPWIQIGTQRGAAKENGNRRGEMINGDTKVEIRGKDFSVNILVDGSTVEGIKHLLPRREHLRAGHSVGFTKSFMMP